MPSLTTYPNGVASFGAPVFPGREGGYAVTKFVGASAAGYLTGGNGDSYQNPAPTLLSVLKDGVVDTGDRGTLIIVRKGHTENISAADFFVLMGARKRITIRGEGMATERPTFTWTAAASTWLMDTEAIRLENLNLNLEPGAGTVTVAAPITVSAVGCAITDCTIRMGTDASNFVTIGITTTAAADDFEFSRNIVYAATAATPTTLIQLVGADRLVMRDNYIAGATSAVGVGVVRFATTASLDVILERNTYINRKALSTMAVTGLAAVSGVSRFETFHFLDNTTTTPWGTSPGIMAYHEPRVINLAGEIGFVGTVVST